ncbi:MAG: PD40 domain-containing protein [Bacteroidales bacterium]|nr:PD40 domain-containing protein [Bacteroidales bacterium]
MFRNIFFRILPVVAVAFYAGDLCAQSGEAVRALKQGDALREIYRFEDARSAYGKALDCFGDSVLTLKDSLIKMEASDKALLAENGMSMMDFVYSPQVVAKQRFSIDDFFLYYPLRDSSWRRTPCQIDSVPHRISRAVYVPENVDRIHWSAADSEGIRNIYITEYQDTVWSVPSLLNEHITSASDEIFPMLSPDGKTMYFASEGLYGIGGYDIYVTQWDDAVSDWSAPVNMGFPYSSPADDFLLINTDDGQYTIFASNRDCPEDSVWVYVLEYDDMPVRRPVSDSEELRSIAALNPAYMDAEGTSEGVSDILDNAEMRRYMAKMAEVRTLRDSISRCAAVMEDFRIRWAQEADGRGKDALAEKMLMMEAALPLLRDSLDKASALLQQIEMEFLFSGVVIDPDKLLAEADVEMAERPVGYVFSRRAFGGPLALDIRKPEPEFDYSFRILDEGQFAEDNALPKGLVYQIQMFASTSKAGVRQLKGLSPVFESRSASGKYVYRAGLFRTYGDVLANLNAVKKAGFRSAFIVAFNDGKELAVSKAKALESKKKQKETLFHVRIVTKGELDMAIADGIRQQSGGKDIARQDGENGTVTYIVGPFAEEASAESIAGFVRAMGVSSAECIQLSGR